MTPPPGTESEDVRSGARATSSDDEFREARRVKPGTSSGGDAPAAGERAWVAELASWLDTRYRIPGTSWRFGLDAIIGILPVAGDGLTALIGGAMVVEALRLKLGAGVVLKMLANLGIDFVVGLVPGADLVLDVAFKAHSRNAKLIREALAKRQNAASRGEE